MFSTRVMTAPAEVPAELVVVSNEPVVTDICVPAELFGEIVTDIDVVYTWNPATPGAAGRVTVETVVLNPLLEPFTPNARARK